MHSLSHWDSCWCCRPQLKQLNAFEELRQLGYGEAVTPAFAIMSEHLVPSRKQLRFALKPRQARKLKWTEKSTYTLDFELKKGVDG